MGIEDIKQKLQGYDNWVSQYRVGEGNPSRIREVLLGMHDTIRELLNNYDEVVETIPQFKADHAADQNYVEFYYLNYKGILDLRKVVPKEIVYGTTEWHKDPGYLLYGYDLEKQAPRAYAVKDIIGKTPDNTAAVAGAFEACVLTLLVLASKDPTTTGTASLRKAISVIRTLTPAYAKEALALRDAMATQRVVDGVNDKVIEATMNPARNPRKIIGQVRKGVWLEEIQDILYQFRPPTSLDKLEKGFFEDGYNTGILDAIKALNALKPFVTDENGVTRSRKPEEYAEELYKLRK